MLSVMFLQMLEVAYVVIDVTDGSAFIANERLLWRLLELWCPAVIQSCSDDSSYVGLPALCCLAFAEQTAVRYQRQSVNERSGHSGSALVQWFSNWGPRRVPQGVRKRIPKSSHCLHGF